MKSPKSLCPRIARLLSVTRLIVTSAVVILSSAVVLSQTQNSGAISGRIYNSARKQYVANAQVQIVGTDLKAISESGGAYQISNVPPGDVTVAVTYTGYAAAPANIRVEAGLAVKHDFELASTLDDARSDSATIKLDTFVVANEREGNAKAIMQQRKAMNIQSSVASDAFGDITDGNVGTFIKNLPGIEIEKTSTVDRVARLRGLDADYTQVTMDGMGLASADANAAGTNNARAFSFEQVSLSSMDSVEINKTLSADMEAIAPAGTINLKTKHAFDRGGRHFSWLANLAATSEQFDLDRTYGPNDDRKIRKMLPGAILEYSDVFFKDRLGLVLNVNSSGVSAPSSTTTATYNYTPTVADPRPGVPTALALTHTWRTNKKVAVTLSTDFRATPDLLLSLVFIYNYHQNYSRNYGSTYASTGARTTVIGADPLRSFSTPAAGGSVTVTGSDVGKFGQAIT